MRACVLCFWSIAFVLAQRCRCRGKGRALEDGHPELVSTNGGGETEEPELSSDNGVPRDGDKGASS
eukprot:4498210-Lingulodinium_polyedra.AAC.1